MQADTEDSDESLEVAFVRPHKPSEPVIVPETAEDIIIRFDKYLFQIVNILAHYPKFIGSDSPYPKNREIHRGTVLLYRIFENSSNPVVLKHQHEQIQLFFSNLALAGKNLRRNLFIAEQSIDDQLRSLAEFAEGDSLKYSLNYFSLISTMGLIRDTIKPILENLVKHGRIQLNDEFRTNFEQLGNDTTQRGSKLAMLIQSWRDKKEESLDDEQKQQLQRIHHRVTMLCQVTNHLMNICVFPPRPETHATLFQIEDDESPSIRLLRQFADDIPPKYIIEVLELKRNWVKGTVSLDTFKDKIEEILRQIAIRLNQNEEFPNYFQLYTTGQMQELVNRLNAWIAGKATSQFVAECLPFDDPTEEQIDSYNN